MITLFACPKPFKDPLITSIQRKAIISWLQIDPSIEILLMGEEEGISEVCREFGLRHIPDISYSPFRTPLLSSLICQAEAVAKHKILAYVNADIIISKNLLPAVQTVARRWKKFLIVSSPYIVEYDKITEPNDIAKNALFFIVQEPTLCGADLFIFSKGIYPKIPSFRIGRRLWDVWLMGYATFRGIPAIDATRFLLTFHPNDISSSHVHDKLDHDSMLKLWQSELFPHHYLDEIKINQSIMKDWYSISRVLLPYYIDENGVIHSRFNSYWDHPVVQLWKTYVLERTFRIRRKLGLYRWWRH